MSTIVWLLGNLWELVMVLLVLAVILGFGITTIMSFVLPFRFLIGGFRYRNEKNVLNTKLNRIYEGSEFDTINDLKESEKYLKSELDQIKTAGKIRSVIGRQSIFSLIFSLSLTLPFLTTCEWQSAEIVAINAENLDEKITNGVGEYVHSGDIKYPEFNIFQGKTEYEFSKKASKDSVKIVKGRLHIVSAIAIMILGGMNLMESTRIQSLRYNIFSLEIVNKRDWDDQFINPRTPPLFHNEFESDKVHKSSLREYKIKEQLKNKEAADYFLGWKPVVLPDTKVREFPIYFLLFITYAAFALYVWKLYDYKDYLSFKSGRRDYYHHPSEKALSYASYVMLFSYILLLLIMIFTSTFQLLRVGALVMLIINLLIFSSDPFRPKLFVLKKETRDDN